MVAPVTLTTDGFRNLSFWTSTNGYLHRPNKKNVGDLVMKVLYFLFCVLVVYFAFVSPKEKVAVKIGLFAGSGWWKNEVCSNRHIFVYCGVQSVHGARVHRTGNTDSGWCEFVLLFLGFFTQYSWCFSKTIPLDDVTSTTAHGKCKCIFWRLVCPWCESSTYRKHRLKRCEFVLLLGGGGYIVLMMLLKKNTTRWCN